MKRQASPMLCEIFDPRFLAPQYMYTTITLTMIQQSELGGKVPSSGQSFFLARETLFGGCSRM